jgi:hypothetical protein
MDFVSQLSGEFLLTEGEKASRVEVRTPATPTQPPRGRGGVSRLGESLARRTKLEIAALTALVKSPFS